MPRFSVLSYMKPVAHIYVIVVGAGHLILHRSLCLAQVVCGLFSCNVVNTEMLLGIVHQVGVLAAYCSRWTFGLNLCSVLLQNMGKCMYSGQKLETSDKAALK